MCCLRRESVSVWKWNFSLLSRLLSDSNFVENVLLPLLWFSVIRSFERWNLTHQEISFFFRLLYFENILYTTTTTITTFGFMIRFLRIPDCRWPWMVSGIKKLGEENVTFHNQDWSFLKGSSMKDIIGLLKIEKRAIFHILVYCMLDDSLNNGWLLFLKSFQAFLKGYIKKKS